MTSGVRWLPLDLLFGAEWRCQPRSVWSRESVALGPAAEKAFNLPNSTLQDIDRRQKDNTQMLGVWHIEGTALDQQDLLFLQQIQYKMFIISNRVHVRIEPGEHVNSAFGFDTADVGN